MRISDWSSDVCTSDLMMLSESQERMLMVLQPGKEDLARGIFEKWDLDFAIIGRLTDSGRMVLKMRGAVVGDLPIDPLAQASPEYDRPWRPTPQPPDVDAIGRASCRERVCHYGWITVVAVQSKK